MTASEFTDEQLRLIRREFFAGMSDKRFYQERGLLMQAITFPATWLNERAVKVPPARYRAILALVISTIKRHGNQAKIERFSAYFLHSVQEHMRHHGDEYYYAAKEVRSLGAVLPRVMGKMQARDPGETFVETLAEVHRAVRSRGGRKKKAVRRAVEGDLFESARVAASRLHRQRRIAAKFLKPLQRRPDSAFPPQTTDSSDADS